MTTRFVINHDDDYQFEECDGGSMPMTEDRYAGNEYQKDGQPLPYEDYVQYYGNPDRHVVVFVRREDRCPCCKSWVAGDTVYGVDFMDDAKEAGYIGTFTLDQLPGYLAEVARDLEADPRLLGQQETPR